MIPEKAEVLKRLAAPKNHAQLITYRQDTNDIISQLMRNHVQTLNEGYKIAPLFDRGNAQDTSQVIFDFLKKNVKYRQEPEAMQTSKTLQRLLQDGFGDCKHYSNFAGVVLTALNYPLRYRFADYGGTDKYGHRIGLQHVYIVQGSEAGKKYVIDCVLDQFNKEKPFVKRKDKKIKMSLYHLSGIGKPNVFQKAAQAVKTNVTNAKKAVAPIVKAPVSSATHAIQVNKANARKAVQTNLTNVKKVPANVTHALQVNKANATKAVQTNLSNLKKVPSNITNAIQVNKANAQKAVQTNIDNARKAAQTNVANARKAVQTNITNVRKAAQTNVANLKKATTADQLKKGAKKVGLAESRAAFLALVLVNARSLATNLKNLPQDQLKATWEKLGGNFSKLTNAINKGATKKRLGYIGDGGVTAATVVSVTAIALPILIVILQLLKKNAKTPEQMQNIQDIEDAVQTGRTIFQNQTGADPEDVQYDKESWKGDDTPILPDVSPGDKKEPGVSNGLLFGGLAVAALMLFK